MSKSSRRARWTARTLVAAVAAGAIVIPALAFADAAGTRPPQCSAHFKDRNVRERVVDASWPGAYLHEMSNGCSAAGQNLGTMAPGSHFRLYYADPVQTYMCYGYSYQLAKNGYIYCGSLKAP